MADDAAQAGQSKPTDVKMQDDDGVMDFSAVCLPAAERVVQRKHIDQAACQWIANRTLPDDKGNPLKGAKLTAKDELFRTKVVDFLKNYQFSVKCTEIRFPVGMPKLHRKIIHSIAKEAGVETHSIGYRGKRHICAGKFSSLVAPDAVYERFIDRSYISFEGPYVDYLGNQATAHVTPAMRKQRQLRDGPHHHITILGRAELESLLQKPQFTGKSLADLSTHVLDELAANVEDDFVDRGVGRLRDPKNEETNGCVYRVIDWPSANKVRETLGLPPATFHITVGFVRSDVHNIAKDQTTLVTEDDDPYAYVGRQVKKPSEQSEEVQELDAKMAAAAHDLGGSAGSGADDEKSSS